MQQFQSTQPSQAVTAGQPAGTDHDIISIHTALAGCDIDWEIVEKKMDISIHTALAGCDGCPYPCPGQETISIHTALAGCDWPHVHLPESESYFNPHSPRRL